MLTLFALSIIATSSPAAEAQKQTVGEEIKFLYKSLYPLDTNKDAKITEEEKPELAKDITNGKLNLPMIPANALGIRPPAGILAGKLVELFATIAPYDANKNGTIDSGEAQKMGIDIDAGKLTLPMPQKK